MGNYSPRPSGTTAMITLLFDAALVAVVIIVAIICVLDTLNVRGNK